jgi:stage II sporulation protein AA (anti-sigma F factor antagonist)
MEAERPPAQFSVAADGAATIVTARGELDLAVRDELRSVLEPLRGRVVVDLGGVTFIDSSCIGALAGAGGRLQSAGGELRVRAPSDSTRMVLEVTGLGDWIDEA